MNKDYFKKVLPILLSFFVMGFVDLVGIASNFVKKDLALSDSQANFIPSLLFVWFLVFSIPTGMLMNKIGRKKTVLLSLAVTSVSLLIPVFGCGYVQMLCAFSLLGIGNAILQVSLNPLMSSVVPEDKIASHLTFGQFVKAIASFLAPIIASIAATAVIPQFGLGWRVLFPIYLVVVLIAALWLGLSNIEDTPVEETSSFGECFRLLAKPVIFLSFLGILCHVGIDVGINLTAPKLLVSKFGVVLEAAAYATSVYFMFRTIGAFAGAFLLSKMTLRTFFIVSVVILLTSFVLMLAGTSETVLYVAFALAGLGNANIFSLVLSISFAYMPQKQNEVSSLMIMALFGGTVFPMLMGFLSDRFGQGASVVVMIAGAVYLLLYALKIKRKDSSKQI